MSITVIESQACRKGEINAMWQRTYSRLFEVNTTDAFTGPLAVRNATGIPRVGDTYKVYESDGTTVSEYDDGSFVNSVSAQEVDGGEGKSWLVTVAYGPYNPATNPQDPTATAPKVAFTGQQFDRPFVRDVDGNPVVNSAGDGFSEPPTVEDGRSILTVTRNERIKTVPADPTATPPTAEIPGFDITLAKSFQNKVNDAVWNGAAIGTVKCGLITTSDPIQAPDGFWYFAVTYPFAEKPEGWKTVLLDQGFAALDGSGVVAQIKGKDGQPINEPVPLDGSGGKLAHGSTPVFKTFTGYQSADFSLLNIDLSTMLGLS